MKEMFVPPQAISDLQFYMFFALIRTNFDKYMQYLIDRGLRLIRAGKKKGVLSMPSNGSFWIIEKLPNLYLKNFKDLISCLIRLILLSKTITIVAKRFHLSNRK